MAVQGGADLGGHYCLQEILPWSTHQQFLGTAGQCPCEKHSQCGLLALFTAILGEGKHSLKYPPFTDSWPPVYVSS